MTSGAVINDRICVAVTNYDFSDNADGLYAALSPHLHTILIDASSPAPPSSPHIAIPNTYYPGLWNAAVQYAADHGFEWLMFVASDVQIGEVERLCRLAVDAIQNESIGIYTPSLTPESRFAFTQVANAGTGRMRECGICEGFFFLARLQILIRHHPIPPTNRYGWNVDIVCSREAYVQGKGVVVDDRIAIFHPERRPEHRIDDETARRQGMEFCGHRALAFAALVSARLGGGIKPVVTGEE